VARGLFDPMTPAEHRQAKAARISAAVATLRELADDLSLLEDDRDSDLWHALDDATGRLMELADDLEVDAVELGGGNWPGT
jgi:hypothetical protein